MSDHLAEQPTASDPVVTWIRRLRVPIVLFWMFLATATNVFVPQLEKVGEEHNVALSAPSAPSMKAFKRIGAVFHEFDTDSAVTLVLEGDKPLGAEAHHYYDDLIKRFQADHKHVQHVQDFWGDPLTSAGSQSPDGKAAYVQMFLAGNQGEELSLQSVNALHDIINKTPAPPGIHAYIAGSAAQITDMFEVGNASTVLVTALTVTVIAIMLLIVYRSPTTMLLALSTVLVEMSAARGLVAFLAHVGLTWLSTYSTNILTLLVIAAGTDYMIFLLGRYHERLNDGMDRQAALHDSYRGTAHVIIGSALTIAGAVYCLSFTRMPYFQTLGIPSAIGVLVSLAASLTLAPAIMIIGARFGLLDPKRKTSKRGWRRIGTAIVRWPGPILVASMALALIGLLALPGYKTSYDISRYLPASAPSNVAYTAATRHFSKARLNPELLMIEADHDLRNPTDMILLERVAKAVFHTDGIAQVQSITRPLGTPLDHTSIPFQISANNAAQINNLPFQHDRAGDLLKQVAEIDKTIDVLRNQYALQQQSSAVTHEQSEAFGKTVAVAASLRDKVADFDDLFRPIRNYFYWDQHCIDIPVCSAFKEIFEALDGVDELTEELTNVSGSIAKLDALQPKLLALIPPQIATQQANRDLTMTNYATNSGLDNQSSAALQNSTALGQAYDASKTDDSFYLPPEVFSNPEFQRGLKLFLSPDGKAARMIITHDVDPAEPAGLEHIAAIRHAAKEAIKGTPLAGSKIYIGGTASTYQDIADQTHYDMLIAGIASMSLILLVMIFITRSLVGALVIVGTVAVSLGASFGLSVLVWQYIAGVELSWVVRPLAVILLLAVGSDYNLLLVSRFKEEIHAGLNTGIIRAVAGSGSVVTAAGLVFAFTMASFIVGQLVVLGQIGTTISLGLLFDTLIVRSFMTPSIAALLGRWFWWPVHVRTRPARSATTADQQHLSRRAAQEPPTPGGSPTSTAPTGEFINQ